MRYFKYYADDTLHGLYRHDSGYLVNRKPLVFSFLKSKPKVPGRGKALSARMGKAFLKKLEGMGLC